MLIQIKLGFLFFRNVTLKGQLMAVLYPVRIPNGKIDYLPMSYRLPQAWLTIKQNEPSRSPAGLLFNGELHFQILGVLVWIAKLPWEIWGPIFFLCIAIHESLHTAFACDQSSTYLWRYSKKKKLRRASAAVVSFGSGQIDICIVSLLCVFLVLYTYLTTSPLTFFIVHGSSFRVLTAFTPNGLLLALV